MAGAEGEAADDTYGEIDIDSFLELIPRGLDLDFDASVPGPSLDSGAEGVDFGSGFCSLGLPETVDRSLNIRSGRSPTDAISSWEDDVEQFFVDGGGETLCLGDKGPPSFDAFVSECKFPEASKCDSVAGGSRSEEKSNSPAEGKVTEEEDPNTKKRIRQMRNRDSAMKSRERRKMYIKELEMKTKYLESECRRLNHLLHCSVAENLTLHRLQKDRCCNVPQAKQESAVLFEESLLLGSLFWLVSIVFLLLVPELLCQGLDPLEMTRKEKGLEGQKQVTVRPRRKVKNDWFRLGLASESLFQRRRYKALRTKMKISLL